MQEIREKRDEQRAEEAFRSLSPRLRQIAELVPAGSLPADVGTDHAYLPIALVRSGRVEKAIAADVRRGPLARAEAHLAAAGLKDRVALYLSDGLRALPANEADTLILAGMGGPLMAEILTSDRDNAPAVRSGLKTLILEPQSEESAVWQALAELGFVIEEEAMTEERGKFYPIVRAVRAQDKAETAPFGEKLIAQKNETYRRCLEKKKRQALGLLKKLPETSDSAAVLSRRAALEAELTQTEKELLQWQQ